MSYMEILESKGVKDSFQLPVASWPCRCFSARWCVPSGHATRVNANQSHKSPLERFYVGRAQVPSDFVTVGCEDGAGHHAVSQRPTSQYRSRSALPAYFPYRRTPKAQVRYGDYTSKWIPGLMGIFSRQTRACSGGSCDRVSML